MRPRGELLGRHPLILKLIERIKLFANERFPVLILGEPGTGKELVADRLHAMSSRAREPFIKVSCTAVPDSLFESAMFGHEKGAFSSALETTPGYFELAQGGGLLLDEIGELSLTLQGKLLRVLQDGSYWRVGGRQPMYADARIIAATNRDLEAFQEQGKFRGDLFHRLRVLTISVPPLREHIEDLDIYALHFLALARPDAQPKTLTREALDLLWRHPWPGNIRELENVLNAATVLSSGAVIDAETVSGILPEPKTSQQPSKGKRPAGKRPIEDVVLRRVLDETKGNVIETSKRLGVCRDTVYARMREYGIPLRKPGANWNIGSGPELLRTELG